MQCAKHISSVALVGIMLGALLVQPCRRHSPVEEAVGAPATIAWWSGASRSCAAGEPRVGPE